MRMRCCGRCSGIWMHFYMSNKNKAVMHCITALFCLHTTTPCGYVIPNEVKALNAKDRVKSDCMFEILRLRFAPLRMTRCGGVCRDRRPGRSADAGCHKRARPYGKIKHTVGASISRHGIRKAENITLQICPHSHAIRNER